MDFFTRFSLQADVDGIRGKQLLSNWNEINPVRSQRSKCLAAYGGDSEGTVAQIDRNSLVMNVRMISFKIKRCIVTKLEPHTNYIAHVTLSHIPPLRLDHTYVYE